MTNFNETDHPRAAAGTFTEKTHTEAPAGIITAPTKSRPTSTDMWDMKKAAAKLNRQADRVGARLVATQILDALPNAAYLEMDERDDSMIYGFWPTKVLDKDRNVIAEVDGEVLIDNGGNEFEMDDMSDVLNDLPQEIPADWDATTRTSTLCPEYAWFEKTSTGCAVIDLNKAAAED